MFTGSSVRGVSAFCIGVFSLAFVGCATTFKQDALIASAQNRAEVVLENSEGVEVFRGVTPAIVTIPREGDYSVYVSLPGHSEQSPFVFNVEEKEKEEDEKKKEKEYKGSSTSDLNIGDPSYANPCDSCDPSGCDLSRIDGGGFGLSRLFSPVKDLCAGQIAINLVTALSSQNIKETYVVLHTRHHGHVRTMTIPFNR